MRLGTRLLVAGWVLGEVALVVLFVRSFGFGAFLLEVAGSALLGGLLLSREAARVWREAREAWKEGRTLEAPLLQGLLVAVGGLLLLAPGLATDAVGLLLMFPPARRIVARSLAVRMERRSGVRPAASAAQGGPETVEPEYEVR